MPKVALIIAVVLVGIGGAAWLSFNYVDGELCGNTVVDEVMSPSATRKAVLFERSCGATTGLSSQISVVPANVKLGEEPGNTFVADGSPNGYKVRWLNDATLQVSGVSGSVFKRESLVAGVEIRYE